MRKIRLTESDLIRIVRRVLTEQKCVDVINALKKLPSNSIKIEDTLNKGDYKSIYGYMTQYQKFLKEMSNSMRTCNKEINNDYSASMSMVYGYGNINSTNNFFKRKIIPNINNIVSKISENQRPYLHALVKKVKNGELENMAKQFFIKKKERGVRSSPTY